MHFSCSSQCLRSFSDHVEDEKLEMELGLKRTAHFSSRHAPAMSLPWCNNPMVVGVLNWDTKKKILLCFKTEHCQQRF